MPSLCIRSIVSGSWMSLVVALACMATQPVAAGDGKKGESYGAGEYYGGDTTDLLDDLAFEETGAAFLGPTLSLNDSNVGYIDSAIVGTQLRFRFDAAYNFDEPDRAEFFYSTWQDFGGRTSANVIGPNNSLDSQTFSLYYEQLLTCRLSAFVEGAVLFNDPSGVPGPGPNLQGIGDTIAGLKLLLWENCDQLLTFQLKNYIPTGEANKWLTAGHYSIEPGLLYYNRLNERWALEAEIRDWIPIGGADGNPSGNGLPNGGPGGPGGPAGNGQPYAGNVLRYGIGTSYRLVDNCYMTVTPVVEVVGWSVLEGQKFAFNPDGPVDADGDNIVNLKLGARLARSGGRASMYVGYGTALTDEAWYDDILRVDLRIAF